MHANIRSSKFWLSPFVLAVALTPAFMQTEYTCARGDTRLASLEVVVLDVNRIVFDPMLRVYDLWLPAEATTATVRVQTMDPGATATWYAPNDAGVGFSGTIGVGGGEVILDLPPDGLSLLVGVFMTGSVGSQYTVNINPVCPQGDPCSNGGVPGTCSGDVCVTSCVPTDEVCDDGVDNDCDGLVDSEDDDCITVDAGNDQAVDEGSPVNFSGEVSCACEYQWDFGDGTAPEIGTLTPTHVYADDGAYDVTLTVTTSGGVSYGDTLAVTVQNVTPTLVAGLDVSGNQVTVLGTFNDLGTLDTHIAWIDWGDGQNSAAAVTESPFGPPGAVSGMDGSLTGSHVYTNDGTYTVTVTVEDDDNAAVAVTVVASVGCGNGVLDAGEDCDDGNNVDGDGCNADCTYQLCGGIAGITCPAGFDCIDDPSDGCDPTMGGADCGGFCEAVPPIVNRVSWLITGNGIERLSGTIDTSAPGSTASVEYYGLPPGFDYLVQMDAISEDGQVTCIGGAYFDVEAGVTTELAVTLSCSNGQMLEGEARVGGLDPNPGGCAQLVRVSVAPLQTSVGNDIDLAALAQDEEGDPIEYRWTATGGSIADPSAPQTTYTCQDVGDQFVTIAVSDDGFDVCVAQWTVPVTCVDGDPGP